MDAFHGTVFIIQHLEGNCKEVYIFVLLFQPT